MMTKSDESGIKCGSVEISWADIDKHGIEHWLNILSDKTWFTPAVESGFIAAVGKHYNRRG